MGVKGGEHPLELNGVHEEHTQPRLIVREVLPHKCSHLGHSTLFYRKPYKGGLNLTHAALAPPTLKIIEMVVMKMMFDGGDNMMMLIGGECTHGIRT